VPAYRWLLVEAQPSLMVRLTHNSQIGPCMSHIAAHNSFWHTSQLDPVRVEPQTDVFCVQQLCRHIGLHGLVSTFRAIGRLRSQRGSKAGHHNDYSTTAARDILRIEGRAVTCTTARWPASCILPATQPSDVTPLSKSPRQPMPNLSPGFWQPRAWPSHADKLWDEARFPNPPVG
jgi:hypothetical protein